MVIAIVKYGMGNVASVQKVLKKLGYQSIITNDQDELKKADFILLPGVGSFKKGMENLNELGLVEFLTNEVLVNKKPFLGICLGMQLIASYGNEPEHIKGLGWIEGDVIKIVPKNGHRVPHLGWNTIKTDVSDAFYSEFDNLDYYFIHSYHFNAKNPKDVTMWVNYDGELVAGLQKDNMYAMQFHPEKSQDEGMILLRKILEKYAKV
ncbi:imidazole glycerol phosphate synthase subunit HisH [Changchengzhania lutea]|uniref:imidazole glycerol phosphate synthase subunit HisH n=1 Tax=Changchengzhania lutea TaxID=2049305 RepID=UPI00115DA458|nr:imidazole glycerol phosphate synthase subunit HisH [Changchengzhania lutea]